MKRRISISGLAVLVGIWLISPAFAVVNIDYVTVGDPGNPADLATGSIYGAVAYEYKIARNETTIAHYAEFLNAVAQTDNYGLYDTAMTTSYINGISRSGSSGSYIYAVNPGSGNKPITYVSWFDAARFCNWLHNGQQTGAGAALTAEYGAYTLNGATSGLINKNVGATVWIPTEDEWYKAAYYDPQKEPPLPFQAPGGYWAQATQSDFLAGNTIGVADSANYYDGDYVGYPGAALTDVGAYGTNSASYYGTNDQAGNVWEWNDAVIVETSRVLRGGSWGAIDYNLSSSYRTGYDPTYQSAGIGFRVASIPEPDTLILTMLFSAGLVARRKR